MDWKQHILFCAIVLFGIFLLINAEIDAIFFLVACSSSLLPDIDHEKSKITFIMKSIAFIVILFASLFYFGFNLEAGILGLLGYLFFVLIYLVTKPRHRGFTHTFGFALMVTMYATTILGWYLALAVFTGVLSHLLGDRL